MKKCLLKDIAIFNSSSFVIKGKEYINYLDTSSITENYISNIQKLFPGKDVIPSRAKRSVQKDTIIYSSVRPNLKHFGILESPIENMVVSTGFITLDIEDVTKYDPKYIYYNLSQQANTDYLQNIAQTNVSSYPSINDTDLMGLKLSIVGDVKKQKQVAGVLSALDDKIELNNKINRELEKTAKDLYNYWFVQFDFPDGNKRPYKSSGGKMVYNDVLKREIPEGWEVESIADNKLSSILKPGIDVFNNNKIYLPTAAIEGDGIIDRSNIITYTNREGRANMQPVTNSVWFAKMKSTKKVLCFGDYSTEKVNNIILSTGMLGLKCNDYALEYIWNFVNNDNFEAVKDKLAHGATQEGVNNEDLLYFPMLIPAKNILQNYSSMLRDLYEQKYLNELENEHLAELRDFLLPMLMNGQVSVS